MSPGHYQVGDEQASTVCPNFSSRSFIMSQSVTSSSARRMVVFLNDKATDWFVLFYMITDIAQSALISVNRKRSVEKTIYSELIKCR